MEGNRLEQFLASVSLWKSLHLTHTHTHMQPKQIGMLPCTDTQDQHTSRRILIILSAAWQDAEARLRWALMLSGCQETEDAQRTNTHRSLSTSHRHLPRSLAPPNTHTHTQSLSIYFNWNLSLLCATLTQTEKPSGSSTAWDQISKPSGLMLINPTLLTRSLCQLICLILRYHPDCFTYVIQVPLKPCWGSKSPWNKASAVGKTPSGALITSTCRHNCAYQTPPS